MKVLSKDDLVDAVMRHFPAPAAARAQTTRQILEPRGRVFLSEHEIKKRLKGGAKELVLDQDAIISPLAQDCLILSGIRVVRR